jgi:hypothetical protein
MNWNTRLIIEYQGMIGAVASPAPICCSIEATSSEGKTGIITKANLTEAEFRESLIPKVYNGISDSIIKDVIDCIAVIRSYESKQAALRMEADDYATKIQQEKERLTMIGKVLLETIPS